MTATEELVVAPPGREWRRLRPRMHEPFPVVSGNSFVAMAHGKGFFEAMLAAIRGSRVSVDVEMYLWDDDEVGRDFVDALRDAAQRGLRVRVLVDPSGAAEVEDLLHCVLAVGGDVRSFNPFRMPFLRRYFHRTHKKIVICDGERAFTGGAGFSLHWSSGKRREGPWHDRVFEVRGPVVAQLIRVFEADFMRWRARTSVIRPVAELRPSAREGTSDIRVLRGWPDALEFRGELLTRIRAAKDRIWLGSPYFIPPLSLLRALTKALRRGVDVQLVLPSSNYAHPVLWRASHRHYGWFLRRGARIWEYEPGFYHAKLAVVDGDAAIVGSSNLDYWSWDRNAEIDLLATDESTVALVAEYFLTDRARSREVTLSDWFSRSWLTRLEERFVGFIERWL
jgi:cardiolipin synthase A/B